MYYNNLPLQALAAGDVKAYRTIYDAYYTIVTRVCMRILRDKDLVLDCAQQVFISLWEDRAKFAQALEFHNYFIRSTVHAALKIVKSEQRIKKAQGLAVYLAGKDVDGHTISRENEAWILIERAIEEGLNESGKAQQRIYKYSRFEGLKSEEIARLLKIALPTVHNCITLVDKRVRAKIDMYLSY